MTTATAIENFSLTMNRSFNCTKQQVYDAWTNQAALTKWFAPAKDFTTIVHKLELNIGGKYHIEMIEPTGVSHVIHGEYVALNPFDQIVFTWKWESDEEQVNSLVTIDLNENDGVTDMVLTHEKLASQDSVDLHTEGWTGCLAQFDIYMS